uniref:Endonuclease/exonuclease/phosphatase domain-containing protein n=1 Tax=Trichogramma kaykai TaxID=54128 RepID=A0ABD2WPP5_9HYME
MDNRPYTQLRVGHLNVHSLDAHFEDVRAIMTRRDLHLFAIGESWLKPRMHSGPFEVTGYTLFRHDRVGAGAGGVALYVRDGLRCRCVAFSERPPIYRNRPEFMFVQVRVESSSVLVCAVYNPPKAGYWSDLEEALLNCRVTYDYAILCGDLNINWPVLSNPRATLRDFFVSYDFTPLPFGTTHHPGDTHTTIDYIYVRGLQALDTDKKHHLYISKHDALFATLPIDVPPPVGANIRCRDFKRLDQRRFDAELFSIDWAHIIGLVNVDAKV